MSLIYDPYDKNSNIAARAGGTTALGTLLLDNHLTKSYLVGSVLAELVL